MKNIKIGQTKIVANTSFEMKIIRHETVARVASTTLEFSAEVSDHKIDAAAEKIKKRDKHLDPEDQTDPRPDLEGAAKDALKSFKHDFRIGTDGSIAYSSHEGSEFLDFTINGKTYSADQLDSLYAQDLETFVRDDAYEVNFVNPDHMHYEVER